MQSELNAATPSPEKSLRPVVITFVAANLAVFALLMTTINFPAQVPAVVEMASLR